jgi:hypothetical protein
MKRLIRKILKEELEVVDKKFCDKVVDRLLSNVYLKEVEGDRRPYTFGTVGELYDIYALDAEIDEVVNNDEVFNELGWSYEYDKDDPYDEGYYYRMDSPDEHYTWEEFSLEVEHGEWILPHKDILVRMKHSSFGCGLEYNYVNESYTIGGCSGQGNRVEIMRVISKDYGIEDSDLIECVVESFMYKLPQRISELGIRSDYTSIAQKQIKKLNEGVIEDFIEFGKKELSLDDDFRVNLTSNGDDIETLANYDMLDNEIKTTK